MLILFLITVQLNARIPKKKPRILDAVLCSVYLIVLARAHDLIEFWDNRLNQGVCSQK